MVAQIRRSLQPPRMPRTHNVGGGLKLTQRHQLNAAGTQEATLLRLVDRRGVPEGIFAAFFRCCKIVKFYISGQLRHEVFSKCLNIYNVWNKSLEAAL